MMRCAAAGMQVGGGGSGGGGGLFGGSDRARAVRSARARARAAGWRAEKKYVRVLDSYRST